MSGLRSLAIQAAASVANATGDKPRTFTVAPAYNGGELRVAGYALPVVIDLAGLTIDQRIAANLDHVPERRVGHVTTVNNDKRKLLLSGVVSAATDSAREFVEGADGGFPWQASVEVVPSELVDIRAGEQITVNGRQFVGPLSLAKVSKLVGVAFVTRGADSGTSVIVAGQIRRNKAMEISNNNGETLKVEISDAGGAAPAADVSASAAKAEILAAEARRIRRIDAVLAACEEPASKPRLAEIRAAAVAGRITHDELVDQVLDVLRSERPSAPAIHASTRDTNNAAIMGAALCQTLKISQEDSGYDERTYEAAHRAHRGRLGIQQVLVCAAHANGYRLEPGERVHRGNLKSILAHALPSEQMQINGAFSTVSLPGLLSNVANKELLLGYMDEDQSWREISTVKSVNDFKQATSYRMLDNLDYELLPKGGRIKHGTTSEESYTRQARTYAKMMSLTREDIINDDLSAFDDLRVRLGRGAARKFNSIFWTAFMDNATFFTTARGNYIDGAGSALAVDGSGLEEAVIAFRQLRTPAADGSKRVGGKPEILLVPPELEFIARRLYQSVNLTGGSTAVADANVHGGLYRPVVVDFLSDDDFGGHSDKAWYLFRSPALLAPMVVSFLDGVEQPTVESTDADFDQLGIMFRGYHDFGCDRAEYLAGIKSKGEA